MTTLYRRLDPLMPQDKICCSSCIVSPLCTPCILSDTDILNFRSIPKERTLFNKDFCLFAAGAFVKKIFVVRRGSFKTELILSDGRTQVMGFHFPGDILNIEGLFANSPHLTATSLESGEFCSVSPVDFDSTAGLLNSIFNLSNQILIASIEQAHNHKMTVGLLSAEEKVSGFLINFISRLSRFSCEDNVYHLPMSQKDIGSYLGITFETVSRIMTRLSKKGLIILNRHRLQLINAQGLLDVAGDAASLFHVSHRISDASPFAQN